MRQGDRNKAKTEGQSRETCTKTKSFIGENWSWKVLSQSKPLKMGAASGDIVIKKAAGLH